MRFFPYRLWQEPAIVATQIVRIDELTALLKELPSGAHVLYHCPNRDCLPFFVAACARVREFPGITLHFMANTEAELEKYRLLRAPAGYGPVSLYMDETRFVPEPVAKEYDAIYVAAFVAGRRNDVKRHHLAAEIRSLFMVAAPLTMRRRLLQITGEQRAKLFYETYPELRHAVLNDRFLGHGDLARAFNRARVNLALSAAEGCMLAFSEGLLCGIPGVSTECRSGRSEFFDDRYVRVVPPDAGAVAAAVAELVKRALDPNEVRGFALARLRAMRARYVEYIAAIAGASADRVHQHLFDAAGGIERLAFAQPRAWQPIAGLE